MPRPFCCRRVSNEPLSKFFKPRGIPLSALEVVTVTLDEYEAVRLADLNGLYQEDSANKMGVSRQTFGRIVESARRKIADALVNAKALEIKGGEIEVTNQREFQCSDCHHKWQLPYGTGRPVACPQCQSHNIYRTHEDPAWAPQGAFGQGAGRRRCMHRGGGLHGSAPRTNPEGGNQ